MGWGFKHTPFYVPDPTDPHDVFETAISHTIWGGAVTGAAWAFSGSYPGPGHVGTLYRAFLSPTHVGASYAGTSALDDTLFALRVYSEPLRAAARFAAPVLIPSLMLGSVYGLGKIHQYRKQTSHDTIQYDPSIDYSQYLSPGTRGV